jgi:predicted ATPase
VGKVTSTKTTSIQDNMKLIESIEIRYLRSIHRLGIRSLKDLTIFSGANDVGKSNILKALNLFFNDCVDREEFFDFSRDFSLRRLNEVRRTSIKGKQFVRIDVTFIRPTNYSGSLPQKFTVTRTWFRDNFQEYDDLDTRHKKGELPSTLDTARRMLTQFLNRVHFEYVPAVRDKAYFEYVLQNLQETLLAKQLRKDDPIISAITDLNENLSGRAATLRREFERSTGIEADVSLPSDPNSLFRALTVSTRWHDPHAEKEAERQLLSLSLRGDGIQAVYIPLLLKYIADNSSLFYIWGFEEPENSVEYNLAIDLANAFQKVHCGQAQIFLTSHSPAFMTLRGPQTMSYRVYMKNNSTEVTKLDLPLADPEMDQLYEDIGLFRIQEQLYSEFQKRKSEWQRISHEVEALRTSLLENSRPVVYVEGKTDATILECAWNKLFPNRTSDYVFQSCDPLPENEDGGAGGCETLRMLLSTVPANSQNLVIGLFDCDKEGKGAFEALPKYFKTLSSDRRVKISRNRKVAAILLPAPAGMEEYENWLNLCIEYYFTEDILTAKTNDDKGLNFKLGETATIDMITGATIMKTKIESPYARRIVGGKKIFAEQIVPLLPMEAFRNFELLFNKFDYVFSNLNYSA